MFGAIGIGMAVYLRDHFTANAARIQVAMGRLSMSTAQWNRHMNQNYQALTSMGRGMAVVGALASFGLLQAVKVGAGFEKVLDGIGAISGASQTEMKIMADKIRELSARTIFDLEEIGNAALDLSKAGFTSGQIVNTIEGVTALAAATDTHLEGAMGAADILNNVMQGFSIHSQDALKTADKLVYAVNQSNIEMADMFEAIKYSAAPARSLGISLEETLAIIMKLGNVGVKGSMAGTSFANSIRYLTKALSEFRTKKQAKGFEILGLNPQDVIDAEGNLMPILDIYDKIRENVSTMGAVRRQTALEALFGVRGQRAVEPFLRWVEDGQIGREGQEYLDMLQNVQPGYASDIAAARLDNLAGKWTIFIDNLKLLGESISRTINPGLEVIVEKLTWVVQGLTRLFDSGLGKILGPVLAIASTATFAFGALSLAVGTFGKFFTTFGVTFSSMIATIKLSLSSLMARMTGMTLSANMANVGYNKAGMPYSKYGPVVIGGKTYRKGLRLPGSAVIPMNSTGPFGGPFSKMLGGLRGLLGGATSILGRVIGLFNPWVLGLTLGISLLTNWNSTIENLAGWLGSLAETIHNILRKLDPNNWSFPWEKNSSSYIEGRTYGPSHRYNPDAYSRQVDMSGKPIKINITNVNDGVQAQVQEYTMEAVENIFFKTGH